MSDALQTSLGFTDADLQANRTGNLSPAQQVTQGKNQRQAGMLFLVMAAVFIVVIAVIAVVVLPNSLSAPAGSSAVPPGIIIAVVAVVLLIIVLTTLRSRRRITRLTGAVHSVEGEAHPTVGAVGDVNRIGALMTYRLKVGSMTFALSHASQLAGFEDGASYRAYYVKGTIPILISAEKL